MTCSSRCIEKTVQHTHIRNGSFDAQFRVTSNVIQIIEYNYSQQYSIYQLMRVTRMCISSETRPFDLCYHLQEVASVDWAICGRQLVLFPIIVTAVYRTFP